jgi:predicted lysophospholipase L1 biosynthesis ABC-type transport system permease subunit
MRSACDPIAICHFFSRKAAKEFLPVQIEEIQRYQKKEKILSVALVTVAVIAPITFSFLMDKKIHWVFSASVCFSILMLALWIQFFRSRISRQVKQKYESLDIGATLTRKSPLSPKFVITNTGYSHYYLKCVKTGEQVLVSRHRAHEDFDIAL